MAAKLPAGGDKPGVHPHEGSDADATAALDVIEIAGAIKWFDVAKGFGFIVPDDGRPDVLLHVTCLRRDGYQTAYEGAREKVKRFINARDVRECIFVRGATEGINLVMHSYGRKFIGAGDEITISAMEHHANIVPWQMLCEEKGAKLRVIPMNDAGELLIDEYEGLLNERTKLVAVMHVSNALGTINPIKDMIATAHKYGVPVLIDGAQAAPHMPIDMQDLDADFYVFSGHKMFAPTGSGVVYGKLELLEKMNPFQGGGDMISSVTFVPLADGWTSHTMPSPVR